MIKLVLVNSSSFQLPLNLKCCCSNNESFIILFYWEIAGLNIFFSKFLLNLRSLVSQFLYASMERECVCASLRIMNIWSFTYINSFKSLFLTTFQLILQFQNFYFLLNEKEYKNIWVLTYSLAGLRIFTAKIQEKHIYLFLM